MDIRAERAGDCEAGSETATEALLGSLPAGIRPGELRWEEMCIRDRRQGDGNENPAQAFQVGTKPISDTAGTLSYEALLDFWSQFDPYTMNTMLVSGDMMLAMLKLSEFQNPLSGPVSYTHLDVYKRQARRRSCWPTWVVRAQVIMETTKNTKKVVG